MKIGAPVLLQLLDTLADPVFVVDGERRLHFANRASEMLWSNGCGLSASGGFVLAADGALQARFTGAIGATLRRQPNAPATLALKPRRDGRCDLLHLAPLSLHDGDANQHTRTVLVNCHVRLNCAPATSDSFQFRQAFGLSDVETDVALMLASGQSPRRIATERDCSEETVRWHIKNLYTKTFAHRLVDLVLQLSAARSPFLQLPLSAETGASP